MKRISLAILIILLGTLCLSPTFAQTGHGLNVTWTVSSSTGVAGQRVYRGTASGGPYTKITATDLGPTMTSYLDPVIDGNTYFYVVTAVSQGPIVLESIFSNQVSGKAPGPLPNPPVAQAATPQ